MKAVPGNDMRSRWGMEVELHSFLALAQYIVGQLQALHFCLWGRIARWLGVSSNGSGCFGKEEIFWSCWESSHDSSDVQPVVQSRCHYAVRALSTFTTF